MDLIVRLLMRLGALLEPKPSLVPAPVRSQRPRLPHLAGDRT
jgi:hypothetical protein